MIDSQLEKTLHAISEFFDRYKVGYEGNKGYRKTTDLFKFRHAVIDLMEEGYLDREKTIFWDLGCGDGRVNVFISYLVKYSIGTEIEPLIFEEYEVRKKELENTLKRHLLQLPPDNIYLFQGDSLSEAIERQVFKHTGCSFCDVDLFYTYITLHDVFAEKIIRDAKKGAKYLVYGFSKILPSYHGMKLVNPNVGIQNIMALYEKM
ncbi:MAG: hypothetical protein DRG59_04800 [Deltaproteobacteria bacterium]|nr:MAG: hypothetical protein DRG59_04800 [Deltaproteobacteria bacterium]HEC31364.1 class I SAM-dependent methyltransferase [Deltaproteobacteria bacterium]